MKLGFLQLEAHLNKSCLPVYIISGDELQLKQEALQLIRKAAKQTGFTERVRLSAEAIEADTLHQCLYNASLLAEKRLIELDLRNTTLQKKMATILHDYANAPPSTQLLVIELGKPDIKIEKSAWYQALENKGAAITIWPLSSEKLVQWIIQRARKYQLNINKEAAATLADYTFENVSAALQALEKIYLHQPSQPIDAELIIDIMADESRFSVFHFVEILLSGNLTRALNILTTLKREGTEPAIILWAIARELRLLNELIQGRQAGHTFESLCKKYRIFSKRQHALQQFILRTKTSRCKELLMELSHIDQIIKGAIKADDAWHCLEILCLRFVTTD